MTAFLKGLHASTKYSSWTCERRGGVGFDGNCSGGIVVRGWHVRVFTFLRAELLVNHLDKPGREIFTHKR